MQNFLLLRFTLPHSHRQSLVGHWDQLHSWRCPMLWLLHSWQNQSPKSIRNCCRSGRRWTQDATLQCKLCTEFMVLHRVHAHNAFSRSGSGDSARCARVSAVAWSASACSQTPARLEISSNAPAVAWSSSACSQTPARLGISSNAPTGTSCAPWRWQLHFQGIARQVLHGHGIDCRLAAAGSPALLVDAGRGTLGGGACSGPAALLTGATEPRAWDRSNGGRRFGRGFGRLRDRLRDGASAEALDGLGLGTGATVAGSGAGASRTAGRWG